jgi:hypothetical protein
MTPQPTQTPANLGPDPPKKPDPGVAQLQHAGSLDNAPPPAIFAPQQAVQNDEQFSVSPFSHSGGDSEDEEGYNDTLRPSRSTDRRIRGSTEAVESAQAQADGIKRRLHQEAEASGEEADDEEASSEDVAPENQDHERTPHTPLRRGKQKWKFRRETEGEARCEREKKEGIRAFSAPAQTSPYRSPPKQLVGENRYLAIRKSVEAEEGEQLALRKRFGGEKSELAIRQRQGAEQEK